MFKPWADTQLSRLYLSIPGRPSHCSTSLRHIYETQDKTLFKTGYQPHSSNIGSEKQNGNMKLAHWQWNRALQGYRTHTKIYAGDITSSTGRYSPVASPPCAPLLQTSLAQLCISREYLTCRGKVVGKGAKQIHFQCCIIYKILLKMYFCTSQSPFHRLNSFFLKYYRKGWILVWFYKWQFLILMWATILKSNPK